MLADKDREIIKEISLHVLPACGSPLYNTTPTPYNEFFLQTVHIHIFCVKLIDVYKHIQIVMFNAILELSIKMTLNISPLSQILMQFH